MFFYVFFPSLYEKSVYFWTKKCVKNHRYVKLSWKPHIAQIYWCQFLKIQLIIFNLRYYTYWRYVRFLRKSKFKKLGFLLFSCFLNARRIFLNMRYFENDVTQWKINRLTWNFFYRLPSQWSLTFVKGLCLYSQLKCACALLESSARFYTRLRARVITR